MIESKSYVFDSGPLSHFAEGGWLGVLGYLTEGAGAFIPEAVERELSDAIHQHPHLRQALEANWLAVDRSDDLAYTLYTARFEGRLVGSGGKNRGECAVLAMAKAFGRIAVVDDGEARQIASEEGIEVTTTLKFLCDAVRAGQVNARTIRRVVSDLLRTKYYLPFEDASDFFGWAVQNGLLDWEHVREDD